MLQAKQSFIDMLGATVRSFRGRVELYDGSTLASICGCHDKLESFTIEKLGEKGKFFGYGISQKLTANFLDRDRELNITNSNTLEVEFGVGSDYIYPCPNFYVIDVKRDEATNKLTVTAQDALYAAAAHTVAELELQMPYTIKQVAVACARILGLPFKETALESFNISYTEGANFDGTETIREALDAIAEATQTIYYIDSNWELTFKQLDVNGEPVAVIGKDKYVNLELKNDCILSAITHATELGDNTTATTGAAGIEQFIRDNPFIELREDAGSLLEDAIAAVGGLNIIPFNCDWRGNFLLEIGDKIGLTTKDNNTALSYVLDDVLSFNGGMSGKTQWEYVESKGETATNSSTLGEALKQTFAKVDKANKKIEMVASESSANSSAISQLQIDTGNINASVTRIEGANKAAIDEIATLKSQVQAQITPEDVQITVKRELENGVSTVTTGKNYTLNDEGLHIEDLNENNRNISTSISNNGMKVFTDGEETLTANDEGVKAVDLHATTFLIIGENSRLEDYNYGGSRRTGCFWIGG